MANIIIIHDSYSSSTEPWIVSFSDEMKNKGFSVYAPKFPTPIGQEYISWKALFTNYVDKINNESILIGVGVGAAFILRLLSEQNIKCKQLILVAPFAAVLSNPIEQLVASSFLLPEYPWQIISDSASYVSVMFSENDTLVPNEFSQFVATRLHANQVRLPSYGHFRSPQISGYIPEMVSLILQPPARTITNVINTDSKNTEANKSARDQFAINLQATDRATQHKINSDNNDVPAYKPMATKVSSDPTISQTEQIGDHMHTITHSLISDFTNSLSNASAGEIAHTLSDYRHSTEIIRQEKKVKILRVLFTLVSVIALFAGGYMLVTTFLNSNARSVVVPVKRLALGADVERSVRLAPLESNEIQIDTLSKSVDLLPFTADKSIGLLDISVRETAMSAHELVRTLGAVSPLTITNFVTDPAYIGAIKNGSNRNPFVLFSIEKNSAVLKNNLTEWEKTMPNTIAQFLSPEFRSQAMYLSGNFVTKNIGNRMFRVYVVSKNETNPNNALEKKETPITKTEFVSFHTIDPYKNQNIVIDNNTLSIQKTSVDTQYNYKKGDVLSVIADTSSETENAFSKKIPEAATLYRIVAIRNTSNIIDMELEKISLAQSIELIGKSIESTFSGSAKTFYQSTKQELQNVIDGTTQQYELFGYTIINNSAILFVSDLDDVATLSNLYLNP